MLDFMLRTDHCLVDLAQGDAVEDRPAMVGISGHHHDLDRKLSVVGAGVCHGGTFALHFLCFLPLCFFFRFAFLPLSSFWQRPVQFPWRQVGQPIVAAPSAQPRPLGGL